MFELMKTRVYTCILFVCIYHQYKYYIFQAIRRLSSSNCKLIKESCVILNQAFTEVEYIEMKEKLKTFKKEQEKESKILLNEGIKNPLQIKQTQSRAKLEDIPMYLWTDTTITVLSNTNKNFKYVCHIKDYLVTKYFYVLYFTPLL